MNRLTLLELLKSRHPEIEEAEHYARILCGEVFLDGERVRDPHAPVLRENPQVAVRGRRFVSRGGEKLEAVLQRWAVEVAGLCFIDAGCSTGGFTDCLLARGARHVIAVDVGYNQLAYRLRTDPRVTVLERTNVLALSRQTLSEAPEAAVADLSFRSLRRAAAHLLELAERKWLIALVKPQFEWRAPEAGFRGVVRDPRALRDILIKLAEDLTGEGVFVHRASPSALAGAKGNREFFFYLTVTPGAEPSAVLDSSLFEVLPR